MVTSLDEYNELMANDPQLKYSKVAIERYEKQMKEVKSKEKEFIPFDNSSSNAKNTAEETKTYRKNRHTILVVDENNKVNYENIKSIPGSFHDYDIYGKKLLTANGNPHAQESNGDKSSSVGDDATPEQKAANAYIDDLDDLNQVVRISQFKTKTSKLKLTAENNTMSIDIEDLNKGLYSEAIDENDGTPETSVQDDEKLKQYLQDATALHRKLMQEYKILKKRELKMFIKKELLLDANLKLDTFTTKNPIIDTLHTRILAKSAKASGKTFVSNTGTLELDKKKIGKSHCTLLYKQ